MSESYKMIHSFTLGLNISTPNNIPKSHSAKNVQETCGHVLLGAVFVILKKERIDIDREWINKLRDTTLKGKNVGIW